MFGQTSWDVSQSSSTSRLSGTKQEVVWCYFVHQHGRRLHDTSDWWFQFTEPWSVQTCHVYTESQKGFLAVTPQPEDNVSKFKVQTPPVWSPLVALKPSNLLQLFSSSVLSGDDKNLNLICDLNNKRLSSLGCVRMNTVLLTSYFKNTKCVTVSWDAAFHLF